MRHLPPSDSSPEANALLIDIYRRMSPSEKWRRLDEMYQSGRVLHAGGFRLRHPEASDQEIVDDWLILTLGKRLAQAVKEARREPEC